MSDRLPPSVVGSNRPDRKVVAAAGVTVVVWATATFLGLDVPVGVEGALAVIVAYLMPN